MATRNNNNNLRLLSEDEQITVKPRRKSSSSSKANEINKKKVARRGMGVEKLERIINNNDNNTSTSIVADHYHPVAPVQLPFSKISEIMTSVHGGGLSLQVPHQLFVHKMGINGHIAFYPNGQFSCVFDHLKGNSIELPSIPIDYCADCYKKKRGVIVTGNEMVFDGVNPSFKDSSSHQGAKLVALHKKASTVGQGNHVVMEYEFFPGAKNKNKKKNKNKNKNQQNEMINYQQAAAAAAAAAAAEAGTNDSTNHIDLSLKLSY